MRGAHVLIRVDCSAEGWPGHVQVEMPRARAILYHLAARTLRHVCVRSHFEKITARHEQPESL